METAWLAALIVVPVFFNVFSSRIFEPDKITLLRSLALVILAAWIVKLVETGWPRWERLPAGESAWKSLLRMPLIAPVLAIAVIYFISTIFSITPRVSLLGSYQRLQGTYTTFSYLVVFASLAANLRKREQVERLITTAILSSLPVSLYGILQRYGLDPVPWGGDVTNRIASNMGNSIFVAAYLIMVFPPTMMRIVDSFSALMSNRGSLAPNFARATLYVFVVALQLIAIYFSGSRGPWLGLFASLVLLWLGLSLVWRARWLTISGVILALVAGAFLITLNIPNGPLESLRTRPEFGRLGQLLDAESRTGRVRTLIWQGASELVLPHEPIEYPDGRKDAFNFLRPLIGYGPESMYVAYNRFYPPELTQVEKRNASPDRSHNETWDSLVITGLLGLAAYLTLFGAVLYYGLKWLGLVDSPRKRNLYLALYLLGGAASSTVFLVWKGLPYLGVALPFGMILGVIAYLILVALFARFRPPETVQERLRAYAILGLLAAVVAHFVEINFGIAIASTRTYFWTYTGLILLIGYVLPLHGEYQAPAPDAPRVESDDEAQTSAGEESRVRQEKRRERKSADQKTSRRSSSSRSGRQSGRAAPLFAGQAWREWLQDGLGAAVVVAILLSTLCYDFISNQSRETSALTLLWASLTRNVKAGVEGGTSGVLWLFLISLLVGVILLASESIQGRQAGASRNDVPDWVKMMLVGAGLSLFVALIFGLWQAQALVSLTRSSASSMEDVLNQVKGSEGLLRNFYIYLFGLMFAGAFVLPFTWPAHGLRQPAASPLVGVGTLVLTFALIAYSNLRVIQADVAFKTADFFARPNTWPVSITIYNRANDLAPSEDYYYLFLGRAYLEYAKTLQEETDRQRLIDQASQDLRKALEINPLNTDHTANLARLYSLWASYTSDPAQRQKLAETSNDYFSKALNLSPNNARLWDEWAAHLMNVMQQPEQAKAYLDRALELDPYYDWTYGLLADYAQRVESNKPGISPEEKQQTLIQATEYYSQAIKLVGSSNNALKYSYLAALGNLQAQLGNYPAAIQAYEQSMPVIPNASETWRVQAALARLYVQAGDLGMALNYAQQALAGAPEDQKAILQDFIRQLGGTPAP